MLRDSISTPNTKDLNNPLKISYGSGNLISNIMLKP